MKTSKSLSVPVMVCVVSMLMSSMLVWGDFDGYLLRIGDNNEQETAPYFYGDMDAAGYSDWIWYGPSPIHDYDYHELLSGEWAAAIYYDSIQTNPIDPNDLSKGLQAMWLTKRFSFPDFYTNSNFVYGGTCTAFPNTTNPTPNNDKGISVIRNQQVEITIDYEVVDLESIQSTASRSPMGYIDEITGYSKTMSSDRFCFLQTYTIRNIDPNQTTLTGLEFYQMLHSHGNNEYTPAVNSTYTDASWPDPLEDYTPYDSVHQTGNFRYDITQWNSMRYPGSGDHIDYISFSSTVEPNWIDTDTFRGGHSDSLIPEYTEGGYIHVKNRDLNGVDAVYMDEVAGSMGWSLGSLDPNETTSITVAFMFGEEAIPESAIQLTKTVEDPNTCYNPGDTITYLIEWENLGSADAEDAILIDYLPDGVLYPVTYSLDPNFMMVASDPNYKDAANAYELYLGTIPGYSGGSLELTVTVTEKAPPGGTLRNIAEIYTSIGDDRFIYDVNVCCWDDSGIIYVDENATGGNNNGTSWTDACTSLQDALERARAGCWPSTEIRVARGIYDPGRASETTFAIPDNTSVYGGYKGGSINGNDRDPKQYVTVLAGDTDTVRNKTIVTMGDETLIDGFKVRGASASINASAVYGSGVDFAIENCMIIDNDQYGIRAIDGNVSVKWCNIYLNDIDGIYHRGAGYDLNVENCWILRNKQYGIESIESTPTIRNSVVSESDLAQEGRAGIRLSYPTYPPVLYNNTIANNKAEGIYFEDDEDIYGDPNNLDFPDIQNCIIYYNNDGGRQLSKSLNADVIPQYCCIQDCNNVNNNYNDIPGFAYTVSPNGEPNPENYHLSGNAFCKEKGNPGLSYTNQTDMDNNSRVAGAYVDIGADEVDCEETSNPYDWNADGLVNFYEYAKFTSAWLAHDPNDPAVLDPNDPVNDPNSSSYIHPNRLIDWYKNKDFYNFNTTGDSLYAVDLADLITLLDDAPWLWTACWLDLDQMQMMSGGESSMLVSSEIEGIMSMESMVSFDSIAVNPVEETVTLYPISELNSIEKTSVQIIAILDQTIYSEPNHENIEGIYEMKAFLEDCLTDIRLQKQ